jgi:hypothetical protein
MLKMIQVAAGVALIVGLLGYSEYTKRTQYEPVEARVLSSKATCYVTPRDQSNRSYRYRNKAYDCDEYDRRLRVSRHHRKLFKVVHEFEYVSPIDGSRQRGTLEREAQRNAELRPRGSTFTLFAHREEQGRYRGR